MMEIKTLKDTGWFISYMDSDQGKALVLCQQKKIKQLEEMLEAIQGETEITEYSPEVMLKSIYAMIDNLEPVESTVGAFTWKEGE